MTDSVIAQKSPYAIDVQAGQNYFWCACGRSSKQPFCDGSHKDTGLVPLKFQAEQSETLYLCGCKRTQTAPRCDGTHNTL